MALKCVVLYTKATPAYRITNFILRQDEYKELPEMYPLINLIDYGITNYKDVSACLFRIKKTGNEKAYK